MSEAGTKPKLYLLDVEGTTSPVSLVYEQLFPYARKHLEKFLRAEVREPWVDVQIAADLTLLAKENAAEVRGADSDTPLLTAPGEGESWETAIPEAAAYLRWLMDRDRKSTALKSLQGRIWRVGFEGRELTGTMFADVPTALAKWSREARVAIYSSGSVEAQQLLFRYSSADDLTPYLSAYFDTRVGAKTSADSYRAIAAAMQVTPQEIVFVSDVLRELDPAREAGLQTRLSLREGNAPVADRHTHTAIRSFVEIV